MGWGVQVRNKFDFKRKRKGRNKLWCQMERQMVGGCTSNQPGTRDRSSKSKSREICAIKTHTHIPTKNQPECYSTPPPPSQRSEIEFSQMNHNYIVSVTVFICFLAFLHCVFVVFLLQTSFHSTAKWNHGKYSSFYWKRCIRHVCITLLKVNTLNQEVSS